MTSTLRILVAATLAGVSLAGCSGGDAAVSSAVPTSTAAAATSTTASAEPTTSSTGAPATTTSVAPTSSTPATTSTGSGWVLPVVCDGPCDPPIDVLFSVPVGDEGVAYANTEGEDIEASGPSALAVTDDGQMWIVDAVGRRLLRYTQDGTAVAAIDLADYEVASVVDIAAGPDGLLLLDIYVALQRYRILELDLEGALVAAYQLPPGLYLEDGLTGLAAGPGGEVWVELELGARVATLDVSSDPVEFTVASGYDYPSGRYQVVPGNGFAYGAGDVEVNVDTSAELGGLTLLGVNPDGSFVLQLDELTTGADGAFVAVVTVHLFDGTGIHLGSSVFPLEEQFVEVFHPFAVGPDGETFALVTLPDRVDVVRLPYGG